MSSVPTDLYRRSQLPLPSGQAHAGETMKRLGEPLIGGNRIELLQGSAAALQALCHAIETARDHVNLEGRIVCADGPGEAILRRLVERCANGVRINLLFDAAGLASGTAAALQRLRRPGASVAAWTAPPPWQLLAAPPQGPRPLAVVDGRIGFVGADEGPATGAAAWRDLHVQVEGPAVHRLQRLFIADWQRLARVPMQQARYFRPLSPVGTHRVGVVGADTTARRDPYHSALLGAIDTARTRVMLTTAWLVPPRRLLRKLAAAARRGVTVELLLAGPPAGAAPLRTLLEAGVRLHERRDTPLHARACTIDGVWSSIGASNVGWRSLLHEAEARLVVLDEDVAAHMEAIFRTDCARAERLDAAAWAARPAWQRLREGVLRRMAYFL